MKSRSQIAIEALDEVAAQCERRWGVGRLPRLVAVDLAEKFWRQVGKLNAEIEEERLAGMADVEREAQRMINAWMALDAAAEAAGADRLSARQLEARMADGRLLVIVDRPESARQAAADRAAVVWTIEEVARVLEGFDLVNRTKHLFDGAVVDEVRVKAERYDWGKGDPLPDSLLMAG